MTVAVFLFETDASVVFVCGSSLCAMFLHLSKQSFDHRKPEGLIMCMEVQEVQELIYSLLLLRCIGKY